MLYSTGKRPLLAQSGHRADLPECRLMTHCGHASRVASNRSRSGPTLMQINALCCASLKLLKRKGDGHKSGCIVSAKIVQVCCDINYRSVLGDQCFRSCECSSVQIETGPRRIRSAEESSASAHLRETQAGPCPRTYTKVAKPASTPASIASQSFWLRR